MNNFDFHKSKLETRLQEVVAELESIATLDGTTDDWTPLPEVIGQETDENSHADASEDLEERTAMVSDLEKEYRNIKRALNKIANGTYGICEISGEPIEEKRLLFKPDARTCTEHMDEENSLSL